MDDLFLKILNGDIPSSKIYEDSVTFVILDINPHNKGHALVIPKERYENIFDIPESLLMAMIKTAKTITPAIQRATGAQGFNISMNNGKVAGQEIMHAHIHVVPRFINDGVYEPAHHITYNEGEQENLAKEIRAEFEKKID